MLRGADAVDFLRWKSLFKPSDCNALFSDGRKLPVIIRPDTGQLAVEIEDRLFDPQKYLGFVKFELKPEETPSAPPAPPEPTPQEIFNDRLCDARKANPGENELALRLRVSEQLAKEALAARQQSRTEQQSMFGTLPDKWATFAAAAKRVCNSR